MYIRGRGAASCDWESSGSQDTSALSNRYVQLRNRVYIVAEWKYGHSLRRPVLLGAGYLLFNVAVRIVKFREVSVFEDQIPIAHF